MSDIETTEAPATTWNDAMQASAQEVHEAAHPPRTFDEMLPVKLTESEIAERAKKAAAARRKVAEYEAQKKASGDMWKAKIELAENERDELLDIIDSGVEHREVECVESFEFRTGIVIVTRVDTGEKIRERAMSSVERQPELPNMSQTALEEVPIALADELDELDDGGDETTIDDPEAVMEAPARVIRRRKKGA